MSDALFRRSTGNWILQHDALCKDIGKIAEIVGRGLDMGLKVTIIGLG